MAYDSDKITDAAVMAALLVCALWRSGLVGIVDVFISVVFW